MNNETINNGIFSLENSSNRELGEQLRFEVERLATNFMQLDDQEKVILMTKKSLILEIADKFERLHEIGEFPLPISEIGNQLYRYLQRKGFNVTDRHVRQILHDNAPHYLNSSYGDGNTSGFDIKIQQTEVMDAIALLKRQNIWQVMKRDQIQDIYSSTFEIIDSLTAYTGQNNILIKTTEQIEEGIPHYDSRELDPFKDAIFTDKPDPRLTPSVLAQATEDLGDSIEECGRTVKATGKMMKEYPPSENDVELEINAVQRVLEWKQFWVLLTQALKPGTDRKFRRSILQWYKAAIDESDWGKHAESSKNPYLAKFRDPKTGEIKTEIRKLTREQLGDRAPKIREFAMLFKKSVPACFDMMFWAENYLNEWTNGLSVKLSEKLSDRSLR